MSSFFCPAPSVTNDLRGVEYRGGGECWGKGGSEHIGGRGYKWYCIVETFVLLIYNGQ
jgi:hypothetical protein